MRTGPFIAIIASLAWAAGCQSIDDSIAESNDTSGLTLGVTSDEAPSASSDAPVRFTDDAGLVYTLTHARLHVREIELDLPAGMRCADIQDQLEGGAQCKSDDDDHDDFDDHSGGDDDDGTPDQGSGDSPGTDDSDQKGGSGDDNSGSPDDDGTPDEGHGDAPGTEGADDPNSPDDDGTPDQGHGDAPGTEGADDGDDDRTIIIRGPFVVDLMTGESKPDLSDVRIPAVAYERIDVRIDDGEVSEGLLEPGDELVDRSLVVRADFVYMDMPIELRLSLKFNEDARFEAPGGVPAGPSLNLELSASDWLDGIRIGDCLDDGDLVVEDGVLRIDDDSGFGECSDVENDIKDNVEESGQVGS